MRKYATAMGCKLEFGDKVYRTVIPRNVRLAEAPSYGVPVLYHDHLSKGTLAYRALADEMLNNAAQPAQI